MLTSTYTYVTLPVSEETYHEIYNKLAASGYEHCFHKEGKGVPLIDMHGLALEKIVQKMD